MESGEGIRFDVHGHDPFADIHLSFNSQIFKCLDSVVVPSRYDASSGKCASCNGTFLLCRSDSIHASFTDAVVAFGVYLEP